jgi:hypothetical protein
LISSLPNGLRDAELETVTLDFKKRKASLELDVWVGDEEELEAYRHAQVTLSGLLVWVSEPPDPSVTGAKALQNRYLCPRAMFALGRYPTDRILSLGRRPFPAA